MVRLYNSNNRSYAANKVSRIGRMDVLDQVTDVLLWDFVPFSKPASWGLFGVYAIENKRQ